VAETVRMLDGEGFVVTSLCSGGLITTPDASEAARAIDELKRAIDETAALKAGCLMFVAGGVDPGTRTSLRRVPACSNGWPTLRPTPALPVPSSRSSRCTR
jgi:sugar phosphate isomerase/epimerase